MIQLIQIKTLNNEIEKVYFLKVELKELISFKDEDIKILSF